jgi:3alpha(or 20beta)-hydroxysteroid dehydrogenase
MRSLGDGVIVNISSSAGLTGVSGTAPYCTSKWAARGLTKAAALDLARDGIRVVSVHPGIIDTPMNDGIDTAIFTANRPIPRPGTVDEVSRLVRYLVVDATFSTGGEFVVDGGQSTGHALPFAAALKR